MAASDEYYNEDSELQRIMTINHQQETVLNTTTQKYWFNKTSWWSSTFSTIKMRTFFAVVLLFIIICGSFLTVISYGATRTDNSIFVKEEANITELRDWNEETSKQLTALNDDDNNESIGNRLPQLRSYVEDEKSPSSSRFFYQRLRFPVAQYKPDKIPLAGPFINFILQVPIFADPLTKQTIIYSQTGGVYIVPSLINMHGHLFSIAELIASGYASLVSNGVVPTGPINMTSFFQASPLVGPNIPLINPLIGSFTGGMHTHFWNFSIPRRHNTQSNNDYKSDVEGEEYGNNYRSASKPPKNYKKFPKKYIAPKLRTCADPIQNQDETDIDCPSLQCTRRCNINQTCLTSADCKNASCFMGTCLGRSATILAVCRLIKEKLSSASELFYPSDEGYNKTIISDGTTSVLPAVCSVEPGTATDVAAIVKIIGKYRVPFANKSGGHSLNPRFGSITSILISMNRFRKIIHHPNNQSVDVGTGLHWDDVYKAFEPYSITVIGGRVNGVGVGGLILGGGYSWETNQYGLSIDNVFEYELVTPNGKIVYVNNVSYPDIFFGAKGGINNFGIVTNFNMRAVPQKLIYGGILAYVPQQFPAVIQVMINFQANNKDPKAQIIGSFIIAPRQFILILFVFYDAPIAPNKIFDEFLAVSPFGTLQTMTYLSLVQAAPVSQSENFRGRYTTISITNVTTQMLNGIINRMIYINSTLGSRIGTLLIFSIEPFLSTYLDKSQDGAYLHVPSSTPLFPLPIQFGWQSPTDDDDDFIKEVKLTRDALLQIALDDGQDVEGSKEVLYPNYALNDTPLVQIYGNNVARLKKVRKAWDPKNIMYLTGGLKF